jgi:phosphopentomutase
MRTLTLNDAEHTALKELLHTQLIELGREIHHTDDHAYRDRLKEHQRTLEEILKKLQEP